MAVTVRQPDIRLDRPDRPAVADHAGVALAVVEASVLARLDDYVDQAVRRVARTVPTLGPGSTVNLPELWTAVYCVLRTSLTGMVRAGAPNDRANEAWRQLGRRAAQLGVPLDDLTQALRLSCTTLWEAMSQAALRLGEPCAYDVLGHAPRLWQHFDAMASVVSQAHHDVGTARDVEQSQLGCAFLSAVRRHPADADITEGLARALGFDPNGWFLAVVHDPVAAPLPPAVRVAAAEEADRTVMFVQLVNPPPQGEAEAAAIIERLAATRAGLGVQRVGVAGACQSLADAEAAYQAAGMLNVAVVDFRTKWLACLALRNRAQYELLVADAVACLDTDDSMRDTVAAYLAAEGSLPGAAAALGLHANTIAYRLRQLAERAGLDARTADGAALAEVALAFVGVTVPAPAPHVVKKAS